MLEPDSGTRNSPIIIIAASARMLIQSGKKAQLSMIAIDQYGDEDTRSAALQTVMIAAKDGSLDGSHVLDRLRAIDPDHRAQIVFGGGLDSTPELRHRIGEEWNLIGNHPAQDAHLKEAAAWFALLDRLSIPYPEIRWNGEEPKGEWLLKRSCSEGGKGVRFFSNDQFRPGDYIQRRVAGPTYSVLFLAAHGTLKIIGFNTLRHIAMGDRPFLFAGAANFTPLSPEIRQQVSGFARKIVQRTGLVGLNSLDFMLDPDRGPVVLEINLRPSATLALYDDDAPEGLLKAHIDASRGLGLADVRRPPLARCYEVIQAPRPLMIPMNLSWPSWCRDRPTAGSQVAQGAPFCTVEAQAPSAASALRLLALRGRTLCNLLSRSGPHLSYPCPV
jgi:predicted ATP-grasp superfamily ATP-dependent carboligase